MNHLTVHADRGLSKQECCAVADLVSDLRRVCSLDVLVAEDADLSAGGHIVVGSRESSKHINDLCGRGHVQFARGSDGPGGGRIAYARLDPETEVLALAGFDPEGVQRAVYEFCRDGLGVDPFCFWTGFEPAMIEDFSLSGFAVRDLPVPVVPLRCYFDNDNDELANMTRPYLEIDFSYWRELIDSLVRLGYNALDLHDHLGRTEYTTRKPYLELRPDYSVNTDLVQKIIDYAKARGMKIQVSFFLGWQFKSISDEASHSWRDHKREWIETWRYYLENTVIGQSDIFLNRPRDQRLDHPYKSSCGEDTAQIFNEAFGVMRDLIKAHNPSAVIIVDLYSEGMDAYRSGFRPEPPEDFILCWPDDGFGGFKTLPDSLEPYGSGIYMHAGFWRNHVVQNPYPQLLSANMKKAFSQRGMTAYCLVNGQTFRHYILNLEACARLCIDPAGFDSDGFLDEWTGRYGGAGYESEIRELLDLLHKAQEDRLGYVSLLGYISAWQRLPREEQVCRGEWETLRREAEKRLEILADPCRKADDLVMKTGDPHHFFYDHFALPIRLLYQIYEILAGLLKASGTVNELIEEHTRLRLEGDRNVRWRGWYDPKTARPNGGYPLMESRTESRTEA